MYASGTAQGVLVSTVPIVFPSDTGCIVRIRDCEILYLGTCSPTAPGKASSNTSVPTRPFFDRGKVPAERCNLRDATCW